jgi:LPS-assembly lipoprotein
MLKNRRLFFVALASTLMLSACGFQLRGSMLGQNLPFKSIYLDLPASSSLGTELRRYLRGTGELKIVDNQDDAEAILEVRNEVREKIILSLNSQGRVRQYGLNYRVTIRVLDRNKAVYMPPTTIALKRDLSYNEDQILAKDTEETLLYRDMQSDLVQQIIRRLAAIKPVVKADDNAATDAPAISTPADPASPANFTPIPSKPVPVSGGIGK